MDQPLIQRIIEGAILASSQPLTVAQLYGLFPEDQPAPPPGSVEQALGDLRAACEGRGVELVEVASGFRYQVQTDVHAWVARLWTERPTRYTRATLETLALIAYRQPITRGEIEQIRGVAVNTNIVKMLEEREWIRVIGHRDVPGKPALFGTTKAFLDYFNLRSLDQLPPLAELNDIPDLEPQLDFESRATAPVAGGDGEQPADGDSDAASGGDAPTGADAADGDVDASEPEDDRVEGEARDPGDGALEQGDVERADAGLAEVEQSDVEHADIAHDHANDASDTAALSDTNSDASIDDAAADHAAAGTGSDTTPVGDTARTDADIDAATVAEGIDVQIDDDLPATASTGGSTTSLPSLGDDVDDSDSTEGDDDDTSAPERTA